VNVRRGPSRRRDLVMSYDYLFDAAMEHWGLILWAYGRHERHRPIVLFDIQEQRVYVYPYKEFKEDLSPRSQASLQEQYEEAITMNEFVLFVRDKEERRLVSYSMSHGNRVRSKRRASKKRTS
jgi:hypothetical protein